MSKLSRRSLVAGAASLPALAAGAAVAAGADDAELLELGAEFDRVEQDWIAQSAIDHKRVDAWEAACEAAGLPYIEHDGVPTDESRAYQSKRERILIELFGEEDEDEWDDIHDSLFQLVDEILSVKASTPAGFAVQVKAVAYAASDLFELIIENSHERQFIQAACAFCNITPAPIARWQLKKAMAGA